MFGLCVMRLRVVEHACSGMESGERTGARSGRQCGRASKKKETPRRLPRKKKGAHTQQSHAPPPVHGPRRRPGRPPGRCVWVWRGRAGQGARARWCGIFFCFLVSFACAVARPNALGFFRHAASLATPHPIPRPRMGECAVNPATRWEWMKVSRRQPGCSTSLLNQRTPLTRPRPVPIHRKNQAHPPPPAAARTTSMPPSPPLPPLPR
jgi:hypothetical protein